MKADLLAKGREKIAEAQLSRRERENLSLSINDKDTLAPTGLTPEYALEPETDEEFSDLLSQGYFVKVPPSKHNTREEIAAVAEI
ncbi:MAG: hypothetical protein ACOYL3_01130 [Desulfuromonadaceae bacterium]